MRGSRDNSIDEAIGARLRQRREEMGICQRELGEIAGIRRQQIQKYETAENGISAERLVSLAEVMGVSPMYFFAGVSAECQRESEAIAAIRARGGKRERARIVRAIVRGDGA